jgi:translocation and assembly module TamB
VKKSLIYTLLVLLLVLGVLGFGRWIIYSPSGTEWLLNRVVTSLDGRIGSIDGTLNGRLVLRELRLGWSSGQLNCEKVELSVRLPQILPLRVDIEQLQLEKLTIENRSTDQATPAAALSWPQLPWWLGLVEIDLKQLQLQDFILREEQAEKLNITQLKSRIRWRDQSLLITEISLLNTEYSVAGSLSANFSHAALSTDLQLQSVLADSPLQTLNLKANLKATDDLLLFGSVDLVLTDQSKTQVNLSAELGLGPDELQFKQLQLNRSGRRGTLTASGRLQFRSPVVELSSHLQLSELDLRMETGQAVQLSGDMELAGNLDQYSGSFRLKNRAEIPLDIELSGAFGGDLQQLHLSDLSGTWLTGAVTGSAQIGWQDDWEVKAQLHGRHLDPHGLNDQLQGDLNLDLTAELRGTEQGPIGRLSGQLQDSLLHGQPLTGRIELHLERDQVEITDLQLFGEDMQLQAAGRLNDRIDLNWRINRLEQLFADWRGQLLGKGVVRLQQEALSAELSVNGSNLAYQDWLLARCRLEVAPLEENNHWQLLFTGQNLTNTTNQLSLEDLTLEMTGSLEQHQISLALSQEKASLKTDLQGGWKEQSWQGRLDHLETSSPQLGRWQSDRAVPLILSADRLQLDPLEIFGDDQGRLQLQGTFLPQSQEIEAQLEWQQLDLMLFQPWLPGWKISGVSSGSIHLQQADGPSLQTKLSLQGQIKKEKLGIILQAGAWQADWDDHGLQSTLTLALDDGSEVDVQLSSLQPFTLGWPEQGDLSVHGNNFSLSRIEPWLLPGLRLSGKLDWQTNAKWESSAPWLVVGAANIADGIFSWQDDEESINAALTAASLGWRWQDRLTGTLAVQFDEHGTIDAKLELPITASYPLLFDPAGAVKGDISARLLERGLLSIFLPGRIQESRGQVAVDLQLSGQWDQPQLQGEAKLLGGEAFLPTLGIALKGIDLQSSFNANQVELKSLTLSSADGSLVGQGWMTLKNWRPQEYRLQLQGKGFQLVNLPELQLHITPDLTIDGDLVLYRVRGSLSVPEMLITTSKKTALAVNSPDLEIVDAEAPEKPKFSLMHDIDLNLVLGEKVLLNSAGIDAKLGGQLRLQSNQRQELVAYGKIRVEKGKYATYGVSLDIDRGNLLFSGGAIDQPTLDILALRQAGEVKAGVTVTGTPKQPVVQLYSDPTLPETDILSYIVIGRPIGSGSSQNSLLMTAAGALLSQGESVALQEKLKTRLGLDVLDLNAGDGDVSSSIITTGKYLSPELYVSLGYSLFTNTNEIKVRYKLSSDWELESDIGAESGIDLFYKIDIR